MGLDSWSTQTAAKANDRWWEALLAAAATTCYLGVEHFQRAKIKSKTFGPRFPPIRWDNIIKAELSIWVQD